MNVVFQPQLNLYGEEYDVQSALLRDVGQKTHLELCQSPLPIQVVVLSVLGRFLLLFQLLRGRNCHRQQLKCLVCVFRNYLIRD